MNQKHKIYLKLNLLSIFCICVSFISVTLAWFAYSGLSTLSTEVDVKAWNIEFMKDSEVVTNEIVINVNDIYPGMDPIIEEVSIHNLGDSVAMLSYEIESARIIGKDLVDEEEGFLIDKLSHDWPFQINMNLSSRYVGSKGGEGKFSVSVTWPLDSNNDERDSRWGNEAYKFQQSEAAKQQLDPTYVPEKSLKIVISVKAEQFIDSPTSSDINYSFGDVILYDVVNNKKCSSVSSTCLKTYVLDSNNLIQDTTVSLLPDMSGSYSTGTFNQFSTLLNQSSAGWKASVRALTVEDVLKVISNDNLNSVLKRPNLSDMVIGYLEYKDRITTVINNAKQSNGYFMYNNNSFPYLVSDNCVWLNSEYDQNNAFAIQKVDDTSSKIFNNLKTSSCKVIPVIVANKSDLV